MRGREREQRRRSERGSKQSIARKPLPFLSLSLLSYLSHTSSGSSPSYCSSLASKSLFLFGVEKERRRRGSEFVRRIRQFFFAVTFFFSSLFPPLSPTRVCACSRRRATHRALLSHASRLHYYNQRTASPPRPREAPRMRAPAAPLRGPIPRASCPFSAA